MAKQSTRDIVLENQRALLEILDNHSLSSDQRNELICGHLVNLIQRLEVQEAWTEKLTSEQASTQVAVQNLSNRIGKLTDAVLALTDVLTGAD